MLRHGKGVLIEFFALCCIFSLIGCAGMAGVAIFFWYILTFVTGEYGRASEYADFLAGFYVFTAATILAVISAFAAQGKGSCKDAA